MNKTIFKTLAVPLLALVLYACGKEDMRHEPPANEKTTTVNISFRSATRGFIEDAATMWAWESDVKTLQIHVF